MILDLRILIRSFINFKGVRLFVLGGFNLKNFKFFLFYVREYEIGMGEIVYRKSKC